MTNNLDELHSTNPKDFGKLLNKGKRKHQHDKEVLIFLTPWIENNNKKIK
jgi:hypothetical protein